MIATLVRQFGDIDVAEEAVQEAFVIADALAGRPAPRPTRRAWIIITARNGRSIGCAGSRHAMTATHKPRFIHERAGEPSRRHRTGAGDDRLRLIFTCCHPVAAPCRQGSR